MIPCRDSQQKYASQTSKKIETRITEQKNAIKRDDLRSLPAAQTYDDCHIFNWKETHLLVRVLTKMHVKSNKHGTAQTIVLLTVMLTFLPST